MPGGPGRSNASMRQAPPCLDSGGRQAPHQAHDPVELIRVRKPSAPGAEVVGHMRGVARARTDHRHGRVRDHELEHELSPGMGVELGGPLRQRPVTDPGPHPVPAEREVGQHADPALEREGKMTSSGVRLSTA